MKKIYLHELTEEELLEKFSEEVRKILKPYLKIHAEEEYLTRAETAKFLRISLPTLRCWTVSGKLQSYRIMSRVRYKKSEVEKALTELPYRKG